MCLDELTADLRRFADDRDWTRFHRPKNLAMAIAGEAGELVAELQWHSDEDVATKVLADPVRRERLEHEMADVLLYLVRMADVCDTDLLDAARRKMAVNAERYRVDRSYGSAAKYTELEVEPAGGNR